MAIQNSFERVEKKYLLTRGQYAAMKLGMAAHTAPDKYPVYTITNIYYDTEDMELIRESLEKPEYKEKLRVRAYGVPTSRDTVFVELKKKFEGVVYKRRITLSAGETYAWLSGIVRAPEGQIAREIDWFRRRIKPVPAAYIAYDREAFAGTEDPELRITFDTNLRAREYDLDLRLGDHGTLIIPEDTVLMELKIPGAAPMWLAKLLSDNGIKPVSFSKYGTFYKQLVTGQPGYGEYKKEVLYCA